MVNTNTKIKYILLIFSLFFFQTYAATNVVNGQSTIKSYTLPIIGGILLVIIVCGVIMVMCMSPKAQEVSNSPVSPRSEAKTVSTNAPEPKLTTSPKTVQTTIPKVSTEVSTTIPPAKSSVDNVQVRLIAQLTQSKKELTALRNGKKHLVPTYQSASVQIRQINALDPLKQAEKTIKSEHLKLKTIATQLYTHMTALQAAPTKLNVNLFIQVREQLTTTTSACTGQLKVYQQQLADTVPQGLQLKGYMETRLQDLSKFQEQISIIHKFCIAQAQAHSQKECRLNNEV